jgi:hypothetical protein
VRKFNRNEGKTRKHKAETRWDESPPGKGWPPAGSEYCVVVSDGGTNDRMETNVPGIWALGEQQLPLN